MDALERFSLKGKISIVTGGTSGIGRCVAEHFASAGADVAIFSRHKDDCVSVATALEQNYHIRAAGIQCDVSAEKEVEEAVKEVEETLGTPDILFNNAGFNINGGALDLDFSDWERMMAVNVNGVFLCARAVAKRLIAANKIGSIVNTASISASIINLPQWQTAYNTSKAAVRHLTKSLAVEWAEYGIRVNSVSPGYVWTEMNQKVPEDITKVWMEATPFHRFATTDEIASAVLYMASPAASYTTGSDLIVDGGFTSI